jgi:cobyrinic acid a,c-diamide synthase
MALIVAGERSSAGKTTVTLAILAFLSQNSHKIQSFKVGPDYIDPMFHRAITGRPCRNLDPVLTSEAYVQACFARHCQGADFAVVEGVMGLFDGIKKQKVADYGSTAHIARLLNLPVLLVIDCSRLSGSVAAIAHGYRTFDSRLNLAGIILNRVGSDRHLELLKNALEPLNLPILGVLRRQDEIAIPSRHLGLVPTAELSNLLPAFCQRLAYLAHTGFDWEKLLPLLAEGRGDRGTGETRGQGGLEADNSSVSSLFSQNPNPLRLAVASDRAFNFYYQDNCDLLQQLGAEIVPWSPLTDEKLPAGSQGLYFWGGFPEVFARQLAENRAARAAVRAAIQAGMPTYAECGGLMYLCEELVDFEGQAWPLVGLLPATAMMGERLTLGYRQATAVGESWLVAAGETVVGHEFHRSQLTATPPQPLFSSSPYGSLQPAAAEGWYCHQLHASYLHLHFGGFPAIPAKFLERCLAFSSGDRLS